MRRPETRWDEPTGGTPRGTVILVPGRGETAASYARLGRRLAADSYRVRYVEGLDVPDAVRARIEKLLAEESLPAPRVLLGSDSGAAAVARLLGRVDADAGVLAGLALPGAPAHVDSWEEEVEARTACPVHRRVIGEDTDFTRGRLADPVPGPELRTLPTTRPLLVLHGSADTITPVAQVTALAETAPRARLRVVAGGRHDVLNDLAHRSVAATVVLFLESLRLGSGLPEVVSAHP
ncbi:alpha/beta hydrolase [Nocardioides insulae]|uniref:alpha/beta hydrolase n=1 Tax=Nocardioides insulae TaxID=394734 RepID=UPI0004113F76|nr:alpha/beta hydrolase [Nocardioides insulae]